MLNHGAEPVDLDVRIEAASDFADLFEVKDALAKKGTTTSGSRRPARLGYRRERFVRETWISASAPPRWTSGADYRRPLSHSAVVDPAGRLAAVDGTGERTHDQVRPRRRPGQAGDAAEPRRVAGEAPEALLRLADLLQRIYKRSLVDLAALRFSPLSAARRACRPPACPGSWRIFGRDSLFTSLQALPFVPELAATTLRVLAARQGTRVDDFRDEEPGKILHELRFGEMTAFEERPHSPVLRHRRRDAAVPGPARRVRALDGRRRARRASSRHEARAALRWIDDYGDRYGDGYVELPAPKRGDRAREPVLEGLVEFDLFTTAGSPGLPRATCEIQGYAYDAKVRCARLARMVWQDAALADRLEQRGGRPQAAVQRGLLGRRPRVLRSGAGRRRHGRSTRSRPTSGICCGAASSTTSRHPPSPSG